MSPSSAKGKGPQEGQNLAPTGTHDRATAVAWMDQLCIVSLTQRV